MTTQEVSEFQLMVKWLRYGAYAALVAAFTFGLWVASVQGQAKENRELIDRRGVQVEANTVQIGKVSRVMEDLVLLQCAKPRLNETEHLICAKYETPQ